MLHILFASIASVFAANYTWELVPIIPKCAAGYQCERAEMADAVKSAGIVKRFQEMAERATLNRGKITIAFMSFAESSLFEVLCKAGKQGTQIEGFFHSNVGGPNGFGTKLTRDCQKEPNGGNVVMRYMGMPTNGDSGWRLHHNKFFMVDYGTSRDVELAFGSANLSTQGLSINFENWNFFSAKRTLPMIQDYLCDIESMKAARDARQREDDPKVFRAKLDQCLSTKNMTPEKAEEVLAREGVITFFSPDKKDRAYAVLADQIKRVVPGGRIRMAVYFFMHKPLITELTAAVKRGVEVELLVDDDIFLGGSIPTQLKFWEELIKPSASGFKVRSFDTVEAVHQLQHNKYLVLEGVGTKENVRVFGGAGQFTLSAFQNNYENFFLTSDSAVVKAYDDLFTQLWSMAAEVKP